MGNLRISGTAFEASAILSACEMGSFGRLDGFSGVGTHDSMEQERREVLDAIVSQMREDDAREGWEVHRRLLQHLAHVPGSVTSTLIH